MIDLRTTSRVTAARCSVLLATLFGATAGAQTPTGFASVDSAAVARGAWGRAVAALRTSDTVTAHREARRAASAWPTQPAYVWGSAITSAMARDTSGLLAALGVYADLELGRDLRSEPQFAPFRTLPAFATLAQRHDGLARPLANSRVLEALPDSTFWPEGVDHDPRTGRYYVASVRHRTIAEVVPGGRPRELWPRNVSGMGAVLGVRVDSARGVLWATTSGLPQMNGYTPRDSAIAALLRIRIADGVVERRWDLPVIPGGHVLGDLAVGPTGDVFFTDSNQPVLYRLRAMRDTLEQIRSPLFRSLQGIAPAPDGHAVYVADYSHGIMRVELATGAVTRVADAPKSTTLGCDGIVWFGGSLVAIQNGVAPARVMRFTLDAGGTRFTRAEVLDRNSTIADEPTIGTIVGNTFVYVANSQWEDYSPDGTPAPNARLARPVLLSLPLRR